MAQRQEDQRRGVGAEHAGVLGGDVHDLMHEGAMQDAGALGTSRRPRGVDDRGQIIQGGRGAMRLQGRVLDVDPLLGEVGEVRPVGALIHRPHASGLIAAVRVQQRRDRGGELCGADDRGAHIGVGDDRLHLLGWCGVEHRDDDGARIQAGHVREGPLPAGGADDRDPVPGANTCRDQPLRHRADPLVQLPGGHRLPTAGRADPHRDVLGRRASAMLEHVGEVAVHLGGGQLGDGTDLGAGDRHALSLGTSAGVRWM